MKIKLQEGAIEATQADVIVNNTIKDLILNTGSISKAILHAAGQSLKHECESKYPTGIKYGQVAVTGGHRLNCKKIYHGTLPFVQSSEYDDALQAFQNTLYGDESIPKEEVKPKLPVIPFSETCIRERSHNSCKKILDCGHICAGFKDEDVCPPCIHGCDTSVGQTAQDNCIICYTDHISAAPVIMLECMHLFHLHCVKRVLDNKWVGARITFSFTLCPICKAPIKHKHLEPILNPILELNEDVRRKALTRLSFEKLIKCDDIAKPTGRYYDNPEGYAMGRYCYYQCFKCQKAYFGGTVECQAQAEDDDRFDQKDLICGGCSNKERDQVCKIHGTDYLEYKCRYCCSVAVFFCFGTTHFCAVCHQYLDVLNIPKDRLPKCPAGPRGQQMAGACPLKIKHPPTDEEFSLGCGICTNAETF